MVKTRKTFWVRDNGLTLLLMACFLASERELLMEQAPEIYYVTDHYHAFPTVLVSLDRVPMNELRHLLERRWRAMAPAKIVQAF
jgi:hypothetical protein